MFNIYTWHTIYKKSGKYYYILYGTYQPIVNMTLSSLTPKLYDSLIKDGYKKIKIDEKVYLIKNIIEE